MLSNVSIQNRKAGLTTVEVWKNDSEKVAEATWFDRSDFDDIVTSNGTVYYRETLTEDASFQFRIRLRNAGDLPDRIQVKNIQNSVRIYSNCPTLDVTDNPINAPK